ncbi:KH domain-containing protein HEN4 [Benincasa hispida]|uniref:KH domain-containing protein HEN4 n=1 Tax=Benincasa hispida TaxID=102211 RepID=UPI0019009D72|nr:KH domain-containing protein HEN4 [Benincasa hispida]
MDTNFSPKRPSDAISDPNLPTGRSVRPRQLPPPPPLPPPASATAPATLGLNSTSRDTPVLKPSSPSDTLFRLLCPASKVPSILRHLCDIPGTRIHIDEPLPSCDECIIVILADSPSKPSLTNRGNDREFSEHDISRNVSSDAVAGDSDERLQAQQALLRTFENIVRMNEDSEENQEMQKKNADSAPNDRISGGETEGLVVCRLLAPSHQVGRVLGRGGKTVEKIRQESTAQVKIFPKDQNPACASPQDELIQISGSLPAVMKALSSVSACLQDNPRMDSSNSSSTKPLGPTSHSNCMPLQDEEPSPKRKYASHHNADYRSRSYSSIPGHENVGAGPRAAMEEDVVFRLLCQPDKVGSLIGKGGTIVRALQNETGASIKIVDTPDLDERVVMISARESLEQTYSPAQEAVIRVHCRIAEIGYEPGAPVVARLLVHGQQIGYLVGRGGHIINEMRRGTGTSIQIFPREQIQNSGPVNDEVVQVIGNLQSVQDALFHITNRLRDTLFPMRPHVPNFNNPSYLSPLPGTPPPLFRPGNNAHSPGCYPSQAGALHGMERLPFHSHPLDHQPPYSHNISFGGNNMDGVPYPHGIERPGPGSFERPPRSWTPQVSSEIPKGPTDVGFGMVSRNESYSSGGPAHFMGGTSMEMVIPQTLICHIYGENSNNIAHVQQISGAMVVVHDAKPGMFDGKVIVSGTPDQIRAAQRLVHAFILCGKTQPS